MEKDYRYTYGIVGILYRLLVSSGKQSGKIFLLDGAPADVLDSQSYFLCMDWATHYRWHSQDDFKALCLVPDGRAIDALLWEFYTCLPGYHFALSMDQ